MLSTTAEGKTTYAEYYRLESHDATELGVGLVEWLADLAACGVEPENVELVLDDVRGFVEVNFVVSLEQAQCLELDVDKLELLE